MFTRTLMILMTCMMLVSFTNDAHANAIMVDGRLLDEWGPHMRSMLGMQILREDGLGAYLEFLLYWLKS